jgi:peptidoglycan/xylan/chitin deacetylase (PgdA/CDA1 family)
MSKNQTISLGLIMNSIGNDSRVIETIREGVDRNLFELSLHGWNHTEYVNLTKQEQQESLVKSNNKMNDIFERKSSIFVPPLSVFNNDTLRAMADSGLSIISSDIPEETKFNNRRSIFLAKNLESNSNELMENQKGHNQSVYHLLATIFFKDYEKGKWIKIPNNEIIANSTKNIEKYGYSIIVLHPQDFALVNNKSLPLESAYTNTVNTREIGDLSKLIESIVTEKMRITGFEWIVTEYTN